MKPPVKMRDILKPKTDKERSWLYSLADNVVGYDDGVDTPGERAGKGINNIATSLLNKPVETIGGVVQGVKGDLDNLMFEGGAMQRPEDVLGYAMGIAAPGAARSGARALAGKGVDRNTANAFKAYHGSPHKFDRFDGSKIGTGSSDAIDGRGINLTDDMAEAASYKRPDLRHNPFAAPENQKFSGDGNLYEVSVNASKGDFVPTRSPVSELPDDVQAMVRKRFRPDDEFSGQRSLSFYLEKDPTLQGEVADAGYKGFLANRGGNENYIAFNDGDLQILKRNGEAIAPPPQGITAYHGSPHDFDKFSMDKIGTGEGAQAYGHGLYFAENEAVAKGYRDALSPGMGVDALRKIGVSDSDLKAMRQFTQSGVDADVSMRDWLGWTGKKETPELREAFMQEWGNKNPGSMYEVNINANPDDFLDWDAPLSGQSPKVRDLAEPRIEQLRQAGASFGDEVSGEAIWKAMNPQGGIDKTDFSRGISEQATDRLRAAGIPGIKYKDAGSRGIDGDGTRNFVVFDENLINIVKKYGVAGAAVMLGMSAAEVEAAVSEQSQPIKNYLSQQ